MDLIVHWLKGSYPSQSIPCGADIGITYAPRDGSKATCPVCQLAYAAFLNEDKSELL